MLMKEHSCIFVAVGLLLLLFFALLPEAEAQRRGQRGRRAKGDLQLMPVHVHYFFNDNSLSKYLKLHYYAEATRLAVRLVRQEQRLSKQQIFVPDELVQSIYNALVGIRTSGYAVVDTIVGYHKVRCFPSPNVENLVLVAHKTVPWLQPLLQGEDTTDSAVINALIWQYHLEKKRLVYLDDQHLGLVLQARTPLNIAALRLAFYQQAGVLATEENWGNYKDSDITIAPLKNGWQVVYEQYLGDGCQQCAQLRRWVFVVDYTGVRYLGCSGHTVPPWQTPKVAIGKRLLFYSDKLKY
jgi:hypothetical protein